ncbi:hypothetical protein [Actinomadura soli]|uniref:hypothetical protein n=1 Tax=Actinomadura soli TaxID=2508997 RepID=UPI00148733F4|nr:hypothetical protein [Actinomadura soli]
MDTEAPPPVPGGVTYWHGEATGSWWALMPGRDQPHLAEADTEEQLAEMVGWELWMATL